MASWEGLRGRAWLRKRSSARMLDSLGLGIRSNSRLRVSLDQVQGLRRAWLRKRSSARVLASLGSEIRSNSRFWVRIIQVKGLRRAWLRKRSSARVLASRGCRYVGHAPCASPPLAARAGPPTRWHPLRYQVQP